MMGLMKRSLKVSLILLICRISRILRWLQGSAIGQSRQWTNPQVSFHHHHHLKLPIVIIIIRITIIFRRITIIKRIFTIISIFYKTFLNWRWIQHRHIDPFPEQCDHCKRDLTEEGCTAFGKVTIIRTIVKNITIYIQFAFNCWTTPFLGRSFTRNVSVAMDAGKFRLRNISLTSLNILTVSFLERSLMENSMPRMIKHTVLSASRWWWWWGSGWCRSS